MTFPLSGKLGENLCTLRSRPPEYVPSGIQTLTLLVVSLSVLPLHYTYGGKKKNSYLSFSKLFNI